jgi:hypothetical protein
VVTTSDQAGSEGIVWASNGGHGNENSNGFDFKNVSSYSLPGIDETSIPWAPSPSYETFSSFFTNTYSGGELFPTTSFYDCYGVFNGACNTKNILAFYSQFITHNTQENGEMPKYKIVSQSTDPNYYAAGLCTQLING